MKTYVALNGETELDTLHEQVSGVGLIRGEYLVRQAGCWINQKACQDNVRNYLSQVAQAFAPKPVWYRLIDMETSEVNLQHGVAHTVHERLSMLGMRGVRRGLRFLDELRDEAQILAELSQTHANLHVLLPFVHSPEQVEQLIAHLRGWGFKNAIGMMAEVPAALSHLDECIDMGIEQVTIGINDLSSLVLGAERGSHWHTVLPKALHPLLGAARTLTQKRGVALSMAGYLDAACMNFAQSGDFDAVVLHLGDAVQLGVVRAAQPSQQLGFTDLLGRVRKDIARAATRQHIAKVDASHLTNVCAALHAEIEARAPQPQGSAALCARALQLARRAAQGAAGAGWTQWQALWSSYEALSAQWTAQLSQAACVAAIYPSMEAFWQDASVQARGGCNLTFWDTYEHGRRRQLEAMLASTYGCAEALLVNSGMSAVTLCLEMLALRPGDTVVTSTGAYFETHEYLHEVLAKRGVRIEAVCLADAAATQRLLRLTQPRALIFETVTNCCEPSTPAAPQSWAAAAPDCLFICDNTVQGTLTRLFYGEGDWDQRFGNRLVAVESVTKYLCHTAMAGVVYGSAPWVERARLQARRTGQQLQEKAFNALREGELRWAAQRMALHARNVASFMQTLQKTRDLFADLRCLRAAQSEADEAPLVGAQVGALIFIRLAAPAEDAAALHRRLLALWKQKAQGRGLDIDIRAGFGWRRTSARVYDSQQLNQVHAPTYLRISIGIEPPTWLDELSHCLCLAAQELGASCR